MTLLKKKSIKRVDLFATYLSRNRMQGVCNTHPIQHPTCINNNITITCKNIKFRYPFYDKLILLFCAIRGPNIAGVRMQVTQRPARRLKFLFDVMREARTICVWPARLISTQDRTNPTLTCTDYMCMTGRSNLTDSLNLTINAHQPSGWRH